MQMHQPRTSEYFMEFRLIFALIFPQFGLILVCDNALDQGVCAVLKDSCMNLYDDSEFNRTADVP